ncbi:hypothetical protein LB531_21440 [Mesorhizobium sp. CO1-1-2]|uniref:hypothetical protein n=1 Tax=Mesorhizobium sp. CO1-1-2 TaxID=2876635 RepID=UPI001CCEF907|nr:hypothetical protein [Mesorhizobium sp. CO1-1-2]MBZ9683224.1 hypothetical protein [Mesorhizobium sp. CO1-1-2]
MATDPLDRFAIFLAAGTGGFCLGAMLAPAMASQRIQWETLATGVLAIAAAAWSVSAARNLDNEQERRHEVNRRLTLRKDKATAARAAYIAGDFFDLTLLGDVDELPADAGRERIMASNTKLVDRARDWTKDIEGKLKSALVTEARPLFDPLTAVHYEQMEGMLKEIEDPLRLLGNAIPFGEEEQQLQLRSDVVSLMEDLRTHLEMFADDLAQLGEAYP